VHPDVFFKDEGVLGDFEVGEDHEGQGGHGQRSLHRPDSALTRCFAPNASEAGVDLWLEAGDPFAVGGHPPLLDFGLRHAGRAFGPRWDKLRRWRTAGAPEAQPIPTWSNAPSWEGKKSRAQRPRHRSIPPIAFITFDSVIREIRHPALPLTTLHHPI
jgi:hypothetical protein